MGCGFAAAKNDQVRRCTVRMRYVYYLTRRDLHGLMHHMAFHPVYGMKGNLYGYSNSHSNARNAQHPD